VTKLMSPLLKFYCHDSVRTAAVSCIPPLLLSAAAYFKKIGAGQGGDMLFVRNLFSWVFNDFKDGILQESDTDILAHMLETFVECIEIVGDNVFSEVQLKDVTEMVKQLITDYNERRAYHADKRQEPDVDDEEEEKLDEETVKDEEILIQAAEIVGRLAKYHKAAFLPHFQNLLPIYSELLQPSKTPAERQSALCVVDDIVEFIGKEAHPLFSHFLPAVIAYVSDEDATVRQSAVYGIGLFSQKFPEQFASFVPEVLSRLHAVITHPDARKEDNADATDNAISAVGRICESQGAAVNLSQLLPAWLSYLPVVSDKIESKVIYNNLCYFVEQQSTYIFGPGNQNLPKVVNVFAHILGTDLIDEVITKRIILILKQMQLQISPALLQQAWASLSTDQQIRLQQYLALQ